MNPISNLNICSVWVLFYLQFSCAFPSLLKLEYLFDIRFCIYLSVSFWFIKPLSYLRLHWLLTIITVTTITEHLHDAVDSDDHT